MNKEKVLSADTEEGCLGDVFIFYMYITDCIIYSNLFTVIIYSNTMKIPKSVLE